MPLDLVVAGKNSGAPGGVLLGTVLDNAESGVERGANVRVKRHACVHWRERQHTSVNVGSEGEGVRGASGGRESVGRSYNGNNHRVGASADWLKQEAAGWDSAGAAASPQIGAVRSPHEPLFPHSCIPSYRSFSLSRPALSPSHSSLSLFCALSLNPYSPLSTVRSFRERTSAYHAPFSSLAPPSLSYTHAETSPPLSSLSHSLTSPSSPETLSSSAKTEDRNSFLSLRFSLLFSLTNSSEQERDEISAPVIRIQWPVYSTSLDIQLRVRPSSLQI